MFNLLTGPQLLDRVEGLLPEHRERLFPPTETLSMFIAQVLSGDGSCQQAVDDAMVKRLVGGLKPGSTDTGGYCKTRARLPETMISTLAREAGGIIAQGAAPWWHWRGRQVRLVDGATVTLPDTEENQGAYRQSNSQKAGLGFPICRVAALLCLGSGALLDAAVGPCEGKGSDEQSLLREMLDALQSGDILLGDALYATYFLLCELVRGGVDGLFEQYGARKRSTDFSKGETLGMEHLRCKTPEMAGKERWVYLLGYNLIRLLIAQGALLADQIPRPLRFKHTMQIWIAWQQRGGGGHDAVPINALLVLNAEPRVGLRPGRVESRALKRRMKPFPLLTKPREVAQEEIEKNGRPEKQR